ncbi:GNAT family N-acetyltransferase [Halalkalibacter alkalisediminis]|uniref:GNAT family N-acetyltransferase n=1 Tax=Halalkalibacter alkalisediminis TaxID=935616 RepID=A0ABV6NG80_9BACI|nr:GNAT family N-acetyltransferase [Halalkalibacter alkalisediminis]
MKEKLVRVRPYQLVDKQLFCSYHLGKGQDAFTLHPLEAIKLCEEEPERHPFIIERERKIVGFFVLHIGNGTEVFSKNVRAAILRAFSIDVNEQGQGVAKQVMNQLPLLVHQRFPEIDEIVLAVNKKNVPARKLYESVGFVWHGKTLDGRSGLQDVLHLRLSL